MRKSEKSAISDIRLIFFCGNPGKEYANTRHNAAWMVLDRIAERETLFWQSKFRGFYAKSLAPGNTILLKPDLYMNLAGQSLAPAAAFFRIEPQNILVCHDDIELDFGTAALKSGGGSAGHNGLRSIEKLLGSNSFFRFRIGISRPHRGNVDSHVLGRFSPDEEAVLPLYMKLAAEKLILAVQERHEAPSVYRLLP